MSSSGKVVERKKDLKNVGDSDELRQAAEQKAISIIEVDLSFN